MEPRVYEPSDGTRIVAHVVYGLHTVSLLLGLMTGASIASAIIFSWPSILAVILSYIFRGAAEGTYLESHFAWQIRTFWLAAAILFCAPVTQWVKGRLQRLQGEGAQALVCVGAALMNLTLLFVCTSMLVGDSYNPFLYFRF